MTRLTLSLLGPFQAELDGNPIADFESNKVRALLAYLAVESEHIHSRETLAGLLWSDWPERSARSNLRYALSNLRQAIGDRKAELPFLHISRSTLQFLADSDTSLDVADFERLSARGLSSEQVDIDRLKQAVALCRGAFLDGFSVPDAEPFEAWARATREYLSQRLSVVFGALTTALEKQGDLIEAREYARQWIHVDLANEDAHRCLMRVLAYAGDRTTALAQYDVCCQVLREELDVAPSQETVVLYEAIRDERLGQGLSAADLTQAPAPGEPPYKGLQHFDVGDAARFCGRKTLTETLVKHLSLEPFLAVVGASGSGKSSLVRAGLIPTLRDRAGFARQIHLITPTARPLMALAASLTRDAASVTQTTTLRDDLMADPHTLIAVGQKIRAASGAPRSGLLLVIDQFEELFTLCRDQVARHAFVENLVQAAAGSLSGPVVTVIVLRADFYAHCGQYDGLRDLLARHQVYIGPMGVEELRQAIEVPARQDDWTFEPGLVDLMLRDVGQEPGALPLLSHALLETWRRRRGRTMTLGGYHDAGGVLGAISKTAENVYQGLGADQQAIARSICMRLTELGEGTEDTRRRASLSEVMSIPASGTDVETVLHILTDARLITMEQANVQVAHEALIREWPTLRAWLEQDRESLRLHRHLTEASHAWDDLGRDPDELYRGARLAQVVEWADSYTDTLNALEQDFLDASRGKADQEEAEREARRQRELQAAQALADAERKRARERGRMLRWNRVVAVLLLAAAVVAGVLGSRARLAAEENAELAHDNERIAASAVEARKLEQEQREAAELAQEQEAHQRELAEQAEHEALVQASVGLASRALDELDGVSPERAVLLSLAALEEFPYTPQAESALARAVLENRPYMTLADSGGSRYWNKVAWSPDGRYISAGQYLQEDIAVIWDSQTGQIVQRLPWDEARAGQCQNAYTAWSPSSKYLFVSTNHQSIAECNTIQVWDVVRGEQRFSRSLGSDLYDMTQGVDWSPDERFVASFAADNFARIWEVSTAQAENSVERETSPITLTEILSFTISTIPYDHSMGSNGDIRWSPDGQRIAIAPAWDKSARIWNAKSGDEVLTLTGHTSEVTDVSWSPDGKQLATASLDGNIRVWDGESGQVISIFAGHTGGTDRAGVQAVAWSPDGSRVASAGGDRTVRVWQADTGEELLRYYGITNPWEVAWSPMGERLVVCGAEEIRIVDLTTGLMRLPNSDATKEVRDAQYSYDGNRLATDQGVSGFIPVWDTTGAEMVRLEAHIMQGHMAWSPVNYDLAAAGNPLRVYNTNTGEIRLEITTIEQAWYHTTAWSPDSSKILGSSCYIDTWPVYVFDAQTGENLLSFGDYDGFKYAEWSPDGTRIATGCLYSMDGLCPSRIWDAETGETLLELDGSYGDTHFLEWSPEGTRLATAHTGGSAIVWDADTGDALTIFSGHDEWVADVTWSPDGNRAASGDIAGTVKGWDAATGAAVFSYQVPGGVVRLDWSPDGEHLVVAGEYNAPIIYPVWQSTGDLIEYAQECCVFRELTPEERAQFMLGER